MQQGGSHYGAPPQQHPPELTPFHHVQMAPEAAPPISTRPPPPAPVHAGGGGSAAAAAAYNFDELGAAADDPLGGVGEEGGSGGISGNRWPRQETLALLKIRSDMDATFRDATLKGPLWEEVSRKLGDLGYRRNAKKCKEKFENVHKYYKRTKEGRAGRQDGKSYRFFSQLEALHNTTTSTGSPSPIGVSNSATAFMSTPPPTAAPSGIMSAQNPVSSQAARLQPPMQISAPTPITTAPPQQPIMGIHDNPTCSTVAAAAAAGISFSSNTSSSSGSESDDDDDEATEEGPSSGRKRKREHGGGGSRKMMAFFEGLMRQVMERQEAMQQRFLEAIEKREQDRMIREEAWRRQEMSRMTREHELAVQERATAASRDAAIISFLHKVTGQTVQLPSTTSASIPTSVIQTPLVATPPPQIHHHDHEQQQPPPPPPPPPQPSQQIQQHQQQQPQPQPQPQPQQQTPEIFRCHHQPPPSASTELVPMSAEPQEGTVVSVSLDPASSRWPKSEVHALIKLRSELDSRYQESGPKGPLWEEISAGMKRLGYNRNSKRCKEKWENINKYFKKVKESNKRRPEDAKTCPYFHQLDALYRIKQLANSGGGPPALSQRPQEHEVGTSPNPNPSPISMIAPPQQHQPEGKESKNGNGAKAEAATVGGPSNGGIGLSFFGEGANTDSIRGGERDNSGIMKKPEDIMKELMGGQSNNNNVYGNLDDADSDNMDEDDEDEDDDEEEDENRKGQYRIQFQRQNVGNNGGTSGAAAAAPSKAGGKASGSSFLAMVR